MCSEEHLHATTIQPLKTAIEKCRPFWRIAPHMMWSAQKLSNLRLGHAIADLRKSVHGYSIAESKEQDKSDATEYRACKHQHSLALSFHCGVKIPNCGVDEG